jgi:predicted nucleic-acid-binding protein
MKITVDTNVLLRAFLKDDPVQQGAAVTALERAELAAVSLQSLCELAWVLERSYGVARRDIETAIRAVADVGNVVVNRPAVEAGLSLFRAGGDFADGVIAHEGRWLGGETFVSFDRKVVKLLAAEGHAARLLALGLRPPVALRAAEDLHTGHGPPRAGPGFS